MRLIDVDAIRIKPEYMEDIWGIAMIRVEDLVRLLNEQPTIPHDDLPKEQEVKYGLDKSIFPRLSLL